MIYKAFPIGHQRNQLIMKLKPLIISLIVAVIVSLFYWPTFRWLVQSWLSNDYYSHGFLVPFISLFFIWTKRKHLKELSPSLLGLVFLLVGVVLYVLSSVLDMRVLAGFSLPVIIAALSLAFLGTRATWAIAFPLCFLIFMVPLPFMQDIGYELQSISINASSGILGITPLPITCVGPEIHLGDEKFIIGLACAGTNTLVALLALSAVYVYILKGPVYKRTIVFLIAFPLAVIANILRIISIILVAHYISIETANGWYHDYLANPLFYFIAFLCLMLVGRIMGCHLVPESTHNRPPAMPLDVGESGYRGAV